MSAESAGMPKRKRVSENEDSQTSLPEGRPKRRRNDTTLVDTIQYIFDAMRNKKKDDDTYLCEAFLRVPKKKTEPQYYDVVKNPLDMLKIQQKIKTDVYNELEEFCKDAQILVENAKLYYAKSTDEYKDACDLWEIFVEAKDRAPDEIAREKSRQQQEEEERHGKRLDKRGRPPRSAIAMSAPMVIEKDGNPMTVENAVEELYGAVMTAMDPDGRLYSYDFRFLPSREKYPDYYEVIETPIDLKLIAQRIQAKNYSSLDDIEKDFNLVFNNACQFNEPGSRIFKDARTLKKLVQLRKADLLQVLNANSSVRLRSKRCAGNKLWSELMCELEDGMELPLPEEEGGEMMAVGTGAHDEEDSDDEVDMDNPQWQLFQAVKSLTSPTDHNYQLIEPFRRLPNRRWHADYYIEIKNPISLSQIRKKIVKGDYRYISDMVEDFNLMFDNAQQYNRPDSRIYRDAVKLQKFVQTKAEELAHLEEEVVFDKIRELNQVDSPGKGGKPVPGKPKKYNQLMSTSKNIKHLYNTVRDYRDTEGRQLSEVFMKLPSKSLYPDYYEKRLELSTDEDGVPNVQGLVQELLMSLFISVFNHEDDKGRYTAESFSDLPEHDGNETRRARVISFDVMKRRLDKGLYKRLDHFQEDLFTILERVRRLSKVNSQTYQDSITLQTEYLKVRDELCNHGSILQSPALNYTDVEFNQQLNKAPGSQGYVEDGNDTSMDVPDEDSKSASEGANSSMSHNQIKYYVGDFVYVDTGEKNTEYPIVHIERLWTNSEGKQMLYGCHYYRPSETFHVSTRKFYEQEVFKTDKHSPLPLKDVVGKCFVMSSLDYFKNVPEGFDPQDVYVCESRYNTKHRMFKKIKAWPFSVPEFVKIVERPEPLEPKRVASIFKERVEKHKEELAELEEETKLARRDIPNIVQQEMANNTNGYTYYEQYNTASGAIKRGDFVYVKGPDSSKKSIRQITQLWTTKEGTSYFIGTVFTHAVETNPSGERLFFKQEVYLTANEETLPVSDILGRCCVLDTKAYCRLRITEISEDDVFVCESFLDEMNKRVSQLQNGLRKFTPTRELHADEIYFFRRVILIHKYNSVAPQGVKKGQQNNESSPMVSSRMEVDFEDSMDGPPPSVASVDSGVIGGTPKALKKMPSGKQFQQMTGKKQMTGYILFSAEIRKSITLKNPNANFGEISRLVGIEWKCLPEPKRKVFEDRAHQMNLESAERALNGTGPESPQTPTTTTSTTKELPLPNNPDTVFECMWESCDFQFEDLADLSDHLMAEGTGHIHVSSKGQQTFECYWKGCSRHKKSSLAPFPLIQRLVRHMREVHIQKNTGRTIPAHDRSRNFVPSTRRSLLSPQNAVPSPATACQAPGSPFSGVSNKGVAALVQGRGSPFPSWPGMSPFPGVTQHYNQLSQLYSSCAGAVAVNSNSGSGVGSEAGGSVATATAPGMPKSVEPIFVSVPPKTQRLLHSEAYIKYIENLDKPFVNNWEKHLMATPENTVINDANRLPAHWLANGAGNHGSVVNALWALREYMMKDTLGIAKIL